MRIESYSFGRICIDGTGYENDILIARGMVIPQWWRARGHLLQTSDLAPLVEASPQIILIGTGSSGLMRIDPAVEPFLARSGIALEYHPTKRAVVRFNELVDTGIELAAGFHLSC